MNDENCKRWSESLRFVQLMRNRVCHDERKQASYAAVFGSDVKVGLASSSIIKKVIANNVGWIHCRIRIESRFQRNPTEIYSRTPRRLT